MTRTLPDGTTITYTPAGRLWKRHDGDLISVNHGPWEPVETLVDLGGNTEPVSPDQLTLFEESA